MKKIILFILTVFLSNSLVAQSYHTITIDGTNDFSTDYEQFATTSGTDLYAYVTWDANYIYFGFSGSSPAGTVTDNDRVYHIYIDTDPTGTSGTTDGETWRWDPTLPFNADYHYAFKTVDNSEYKNVYSSGSWNNSAFTTSNWKGSGFWELSISRSDIGAPSEIKILMYVEEDWSGGNICGGLPSDLFTNTTTQGSIAFNAHYRGYTLDDGYSPNHANSYDYVMRKNYSYLSFDGSNDYVKYTDDDTLGLMDGATDYTIEAWIYPVDGTVAEYDRVLQRYYSFAIVMYDGDDDGNVQDWYFQVYDTVSSSWKYYNTDGDASLTLDAWNHIAVINNSSDGTLKLFVNGTDVTNSGGYTNIALQASVPDDNLYIGQKGNATSYFGGYIDEVRLKNVAVNPTDLHTSITDNAYYSDNSTAGLFHFDEGSGSTTVNSVSSVDASVNGSTWETTVTALPLPVELTYFTANKVGNTVLLNWETATEVNNYGFSIERKSNGEWTEIGFVEGHGTSNSPNSYSFVDDLASGNLQYRLKQLDNDGSFEYSDVVSVEVGLSYKLAQNHPNPFNPATRINFSLPESAKVSITIYNALGEKVTELTNKVYNAGNHSVDFNASNLTSGIYFYRLNSANFSETKKMILMK